MSYTNEFQAIQVKLNTFLQKKLYGEIQNASLEKRAQKLVDKWWADQRKPVIIGDTNVMITGCVLGFEIGTIKVHHWITRFVKDRFGIHQVMPKAIALGTVNGSQLYIADVEGRPHLCARNTPINVERWAPHYGNIPNPTSQPELFVALERAKALGYLNHLKGL